MSQRTIAIGDIHGCDLALSAVLEAISPGPDDLIITLGDMINRSPGSRGVLDRLITLSEQCDYVPLRGNHDQMLLEAIEGRHPTTWLGMGGMATLESYGLNPDLVGFPAEHAAFLRSCRRFFETKTHFFVHANYSPQVRLSFQADAILLWESLTESVPEAHFSGRRAIVGHTPQKSGEILDLGHLVCIDTWCYGGGWLTAFDVDSGQIWQADRDGRLRSHDESN